MRIEMDTQPGEQGVAVIGQMIISDSLKAVLSQAGHKTVGVGAADLMRFNRLARLNQLVTGRDHEHAGLRAHSDTRHAGARCDRNLRPAESQARGQ